jgi:outer membrane protein assembly factor BamB
MKKLLLTAVVALAACKGGGTFGLSSDDNNPAALAKAFQAEQKPAAGKPMNASGKALAFLVSPNPKKLTAYDLDAGKVLWSVDAAVTSRVMVGSNMVAAREGDDSIVARDLATGKPSWTHKLDAKAKFLGAAADGERVFFVEQDDSGAKRTWFLVAIGPGGSELWRAEAPGTLGAPAARGGLVYMPFLSQWLTILDAKTGAQLARIRQTDEELSFVRTTSDGVFYGSKGVFMLDDKSVAGTRQGATYRTAKLPPEFVRSQNYHYDAFNPVQAGYSAFDRNRVLWRAKADGGKLAFEDNLVVVFTFRFFFAFDATTGELKWVHWHPGADVVSVEHVGASIVYVSLEGELGALDARTGARLFETKLDMRVTGATFDADGFRPKGEGEAPNTVGALAAIVADKDSRFQPVKLFAISSLGGVPGADASAALLKVILDDATPPPVYQKAAEVLVGRKDAAAMPMFLDALEPHYDFLAGTRPRAVEVLAKVLGAIGKPEAAPALIAQLEDPQTPLGTIKELADALGKCGNKDAIPPLRSFLLANRADPQFAGDSAPLNATINALLLLGGGAERELVAFVAEDPRTQPPVAEYARYALSKETQGGK